MYRMTGYGLDPSYGQPAPTTGTVARPGSSFLSLLSRLPTMPGPVTDGTVQWPGQDPPAPDPGGVVGDGVRYPPPDGGVPHVPPDDVATPPVPPPPPPPPPSTEPEGGVVDEVTGWWAERTGLEKGALVLGLVGVGVASYALGRRRGQTTNRATERF